MLLKFDLRIGLLAVIYFFTCAVCEKQYGTQGDSLYVAEEQQRGLGKTIIINRVTEEETPSLERRKRDASVSSTPALEKNITTWVTVHFLIRFN